ncbi:hypothetical protein HAX54_002763 [Datura stramonium]|uniref:Peptidase S1 domain-containing protein n=1 Tax=Datura stramonium TaxID=4076 RepID=A0ABS8T5J8_DATST|nr:hypothetical protein [Datura stramonium]
MQSHEGNSGGPLVNVDGEVIGVSIMKVLAADGLGFAVPIDSVTKIIDHFKKRGRVIRPWLGLKMLDLNDMVVAQLQERDPSFPKINKGVLVSMAVAPQCCVDWRNMYYHSRSHLGNILSMVRWVFNPTSYPVVMGLQPSRLTLHRHVVSGNYHVDNTLRSSKWCSQNHFIPYGLLAPFSVIFNHVALGP